MSIDSPYFYCKMGRESTLIRENAVGLGKWPKLTREELDRIETKQNELLYDFDPALFDTCVICETSMKGKKKTDHFVSAVTEKNARFRDGYILAINHPMNLVYCCAKCNNESKKMNILEKNDRRMRYYEYLLANIPTNQVSREQWNKLTEQTIANETARQTHVTRLLNTQL